VDFSARGAIAASECSVTTPTALPPQSDTSKYMVVDPDTGGQKGSALARYDLIPVGPLKKLAEHYGYGATKYDENNWRRGYAWSLSYAALQRHLNAFWGGEDMDPDSGRPHLAAAAFHCFALLEFMETNRERDDRA
jgi:hypothetical protein